MDAIAGLAAFGLTRQEAGVYLRLCGDDGLSGYEVARQAGISRSNAYAALASLVDKGAAYRLDGATPKYAAVPVADFTAATIRRLSDVAGRLAAAVPRRRAPAEGYLTIVGADNIVARLRLMVGSARERVYCSLPARALRLLRGDLAAALGRGVKVVVLSDAAERIGGTEWHKTEPPEGQVRLIADSIEVLTGDLSGGDGASCLYSRREPLVKLFKDALRNEIRLIALEAKGRRKS
jgi:HTH-type transcriptional regulator, sugar sensing transcriptional regulator